MVDFDGWWTFPLHRRVSAFYHPFISRGGILLNHGGQKRDVDSWKRTLFWICLLVAVGIVVITYVDTHSGLVKDIPKGWLDVLKAALVLLIGGIISALLERRLFRVSVDKLGPQHSTTIRYVARLLLFLTVVVAVLTAFGAGLPSVVFGGAFVTVVVGLAGQTVLANIIGGIWLIFFRPFRIGDSIGLVAWQFPMLMPSFPHESLRPMYYGTVQDINLVYTEIQNGDGYLQVIPNGLIAQSFVENRSREASHRVRMRFDVPYEIEPNTFTETLKHALSAEFPDPLNATPEVLIADIYPTAYSVVVMVISMQKEDHVRHKVLGHCICIMQNMKTHEELNLETNLSKLS